MQNGKLKLNYSVTFSVLSVANATSHATEPGVLHEAAGKAKSQVQWQYEDAKELYGSPCIKCNKNASAWCASNGAVETCVPAGPGLLH
jgi:hypothetical protein